MRETSLKSLLPRPPIVVVVGHVDHGKTSLLDYIRKTNVVGREAGSITQSTGAYEIKHPPTGGGKYITFIDTPGHEAFSRMRERGAKVADIAILVVAADEGIKPQTLEALNILKNSKTPFVVAITKIDKPNANVEKVKNELLANGVLLEGYGGDISWQAISSKTGAGIDELLNFILLMGEVLDLKYDPHAPAKGFIIESLKDMRRGIIARLVLRDGVLHAGDELKTVSASGRIKILENFLGEKVSKLIPSAPASVVGFESIPLVGEEFYAGELPSLKIIVPGKEEIEKEINEEGKINAILKADTSGSLEVLKQVIEHLINLKSISVGDITDGDVKLAVSSQSIIIGFRIKANKAAESLAKAHGIKMFVSDIIYKLVESIEIYNKEQLGPVFSGELDVLKVFGEESKRQIIGGRVAFGFIRTGSEIHIERNDSSLGVGRILNLQERKTDVSEVKEGTECGLLILSETKIRAGDKIKTL